MSIKIVEQQLCTKLCGIMALVLRYFYLLICVMNHFCSLIQRYLSTLSYKSSCQSQAREASAQGTKFKKHTLILRVMALVTAKRFSNPGKIGEEKEGEVNEHLWSPTMYHYLLKDLYLIIGRPQNVLNLGVDSVVGRLGSNSSYDRQQLCDLGKVS